VNDSPLARKIARRIRAEGPLSLAAWTAMALHDPDYGYYRRRDPIGAPGDFITAPEISQVFGELIGLWCAICWDGMGRPEPVILAELGPGTGMLMADLLRAADAVPGFRRALRLHLIETSPILRARQQQRLGAAQPVWLDRPEDLPAGPLLLVANEFLDALPVRQLVRGRRAWCERLVALDPEGNAVLADGPESPVLSLFVAAPLRHDAPPGTVVEICPPALALAATLGARLAAGPGAALFVDYGYVEPPRHATLRAVRRHRPAELLSDPGTADLSADVDFAAFAEAARAGGARIHGPVPQRQFLLALGAEARVAALEARATPAQRSRLAGAVERLLDPAQMGTLFKAMALTSPALPPPPGFAAGGEPEPE
jgi:NADH dehydrogenase [ubiquinone] 1 alpha subcomplex assembly factor 7